MSPYPASTPKLNLLSSLAFALLLGATTLAAAPDPASTINVWLGTPPGDTGTLPAENVRVSTTPRPQKEVFNVSTPTLEIYRPAKDKDTGAAIIVMPGGGFGVLKMDYEGEDCAAWLSTMGVTGIALKYRVPQRPNMARYMAPAQDAQRAVSLVRSQAVTLGIKPDRIGLMGFSAGGISAVVAATNNATRLYPAADDVDKVSSRPDFLALIYTGTILVTGTTQLLPDIHVGKDTPPVFFAVSDSDHTEFSIYLYLALKQAGVSSEMHLYSDGEHGFGMLASADPHGSWTARFMDWLNFKGFLKRDTAAPATATK